MSYGVFLTQALLISLSGVMAPGPLTVVVVGKGARSARAGVLIALGHGIVEFPLMILILVGLGPILENRTAGAAIGLAGGLLLLWMGAGLLRSVRARDASEPHRQATPFVAGMLMTVANPYFIVWWATVGATLVFGARSYGLWPFVIFAVAHWSLDLVWDFVLSAASYRGTRLMGKRFRLGVSLVCGALLLFFGGRFIVDALRNLL